MRHKVCLRHKKGAPHPPKRKNAQAERYRHRRINLWHKIVDLHDLFGVRSYTVLKDDKNTWVLNSDPTRLGWPPMASVSGCTARRVCLTMDECRRGPTPSRRSHLPRACKSVEQEADEDVVEDEGEEKEVEEEEEEEEEEDGHEGPTNQDDEDGEEVEDVAEGAAYQPMEVAEAAAEAAVEAAVEQAVEAQIDHSIEKRAKRIRDIWDVPDSPMGEPTSSTNKDLQEREERERREREAQEGEEQGQREWEEREQRENEERELVCIHFKIRERNDWRNAQSLWIDRSDPSEVARVAKKSMRKGLRIFDTNMRLLGPDDCFEVVTADGTNTILLVPQTALDIDDRLLDSASILSYSAIVDSVRNTRTQERLNTRRKLRG